MKFFKRLRFVLKYWKSIPFVVEFFLSREVEVSKKVLSVLLILTYVFFPFDLIPDFIYLLGILDDIVITSFIMERMVNWAPEALKNKYHLHEKI
ncbi:YkvA family protein [Mesobacillus maritimus]|uniref:DUF1232 domain-containing protein n=1 Tax=Mesobacillus maritimus TaxID=1643336 RepID=A0ABS7K9G9_9BACI|nr:DUF1232 domain-containing protein [Mesobacillus maritimus]MBY0098894.1 DUF1232 domain-containing protein [Mesobacillus maritimus]